MKRSLNLVYNTKHSYKLKLDFDINILRHCSPPYQGNSFDELKKYLLRYVFGGDDGCILGHVTVDYKWIQQNESILRSCDLGNGHTLYDELDLDFIIYEEQESPFVEINWNESSDIQEI